MSWWVQVQTPRLLLLLLPEHLGNFGFVWNMVVSDESEGVGVLCVWLAFGFGEGDLGFKYSVP